VLKHRLADDKATIGSLKRKRTPGFEACFEAIGSFLIAPHGTILAANGG
jgi:hypothetical protein